jgi:mRNA-degrading endonuclease RelE of RelBE toxin-antitoxin system
LIRLDLGYSYCIDLTEEEKFYIDKQVKKNRFELKFAIFFPFLPLSMPSLPFQPVEGFSPQQTIRSAKDRAQQAFAEKVGPLFQFTEACEEAYNEYKVYSEMSRTLSKVSKKVRKNEDTSKGLDKLQEQLKNGELHAGRGAKKLSGTKTIFYMRSGGEARLFFKYSEDEEGTVKVIGESDKDTETKVIDNLKKNYK